MLHPDDRDRARVRQRLQLLPRPRGQLLAAGTGFDHARTPRATMPRRACHTSFMQTSETYMIGRLPGSINSAISS